MNRPVPEYIVLRFMIGAHKQSWLLPHHHARQFYLQENVTLLLGFSVKGLSRLFLFKPSKVSLYTFDDTFSEYAAYEPVPHPEVTEFQLLAEVFARLSFMQHLSGPRPQYLVSARPL